MFYLRRELPFAVDYGAILRFFGKNRRVMGAFFYKGDSGLDPAEEKFFGAIAYSGYTLRTKPPKYRGDQAVKANFDVELTIDVMSMIDDMDTILLLSGDGDFAPLVDYLKAKDKWVIVLSSRGHVASELAETANEYYDLLNLEHLFAYTKPQPKQQPIRQVRSLPSIR